MKKLFYIVVIVLVCAFLAGNLFAVLHSAGQVSHRYYPLYTRVSEAQENQVFFVDPTGNEWGIMADGDRWNLGDQAVLIMGDNGTPGIITDDVIIDAHGF